MWQGKNYITILDRLLFLSFFILFSSISSAQEICDNGIDDDGNGLIDLNDPACQCHFKSDTNLLLNPSFETYKHCSIDPFNYNSYARNFDIVDPWRYGVIESSDLTFYRNFSCSYDSLTTVLTHPGIYPQDGKGIYELVIDGTVDIPENKSEKGYIAQCLQTPLIKEKKYTITFFVSQFAAHSYYPFNLAIFGNSDCSAMPIGRDALYGRKIGCPANYTGWVQLGKSSARIHPQGFWMEMKIDFVPTQDINVIEIGPDCSWEVNRIYLFVDNFQLSETKDFHLQYIQQINGSPCTGGYTLQAPIVPNATFQWYRNGIALVGQKNTTINLPDSSAAGIYNVRISTNTDCKISEPYLLQMSPLLQVRMPTDTFLCTNDTVRLAKVLPGVTYNWRGLNDSVINISNSGNYFITASDSLGCKNNYRVHVSSQACSLCDVHLPSAFTPNGDGLNDVFKGRSICPVAEYHLIIYNRWGEKIFESTDINEGWNGKIGGKIAETGAFVYYLRFKNSSNENEYKTIKGTVLLIR